MLYHYIPSSGLDYGLDFGHCAIRTSHKMAQRLWKRGASTVRHMTKYAHMYRTREKERERDTRACTCASASTCLCWRSPGTPFLTSFPLL